MAEIEWKGKFRASAASFFFVDSGVFPVHLVIHQATISCTPLKCNIPFFNLQSNARVMHQYCKSNVPLCVFQTLLPLPPPLPQLRKRRA